MGIPVVSAAVLAVLLQIAAVAGCASYHTGRSLQVVRRYPAAEAHQGVAVDSRFFYAIDNAAIGKYDKTSGERVAGWQADPDSDVLHLNGGIIIDGALYSAHSNYPETPMASSIEVFDPARMAHLRGIALPSGIGSATWVDFADGSWWVTFAHYAGRGGEPGKGPEHTTLVRFDRDWRRQDAWTFPREVVRRWGEMSSSGGVWAGGRRFFATGHDAPEVYVLDVPESGRELVLAQILAVESEGQGIAIDRAERLLYSIKRRSREVIVSRMPE